MQARLSLYGTVRIPLGTGLRKSLYNQTISKSGFALCKQVAIVLACPAPSTAEIITTLLFEIIPAVAWTTEGTFRLLFPCRRAYASMQKSEK